MTWQIYAIGDEAFLLKIFQFLSMLNSPGTELYTRLGLLSALIGLIMILIQAVTSAGRQFGFGAYFFSIMMFMAMYNVNVPVQLVDYHTGQADVVENVPLATAVLGSLVSQGGVAIINVFQQGTEPANGTVISADYALRALAATRALTDGDSCAVNAVACPFQQTLESYMAECVIPQYKGRGQLNGQEGWWNGNPATAPQALAALQVNNQTTTTMDYLSSTSGSSGSSTSAPSVQTCAQTYTDIQKATQDVRLKDSLASIYLAAAGQNIPSGASAGTATATANSVLQNAFGGMQQGVTDSSSAISGELQQAQSAYQDEMLNATLVRAMTYAQKRNAAVSRADLANAAIVESADQRRNVSYASEQSLFGSTLQATITFFEGTIYGLAPFMAFLIPLGGVGFRYFMRYVQLLVWLFLWLPLMDFVGLFEMMVVTRQMNALSPALGNGPLTSMVGIMQTQYSIGDWIAIGGYLSTAVIGLAGFVVFGSVAAFQSIAAAAHGPDSVNPSGIAPEVMNSAPVLQTGPMYSQTGGGASMLEGGASMSFTRTEGIQEQMAARKADAIQHMKSLGISDSMANQMTSSMLRQWGQQHMAGQGTSASVAKGESTSNSYQLQSTNAYQKSISSTENAGHGSQIALSDSLALKEEVGTPLQGVLGDGVSLTNTTTLQGSGNMHQASDTNVGSSQNVGGTASTGTQGDVSRSMNQQASATQSEQDQSGTSAGVGSSTSKGETKQEAYQKALTDLETVESMRSLMSSSGAEARVDARQIGAALPQHMDAYSTVVNTARAFDAQGFHDFNTALGHEFTDSEQRAAVAGMATLQSVVSDHSGRFSEAQKEEASRVLGRGIDAVDPVGSSVRGPDIGGVFSAVGGGETIAEQGRQMAGQAEARTSGVPGAVESQLPMASGFNLVVGDVQSKVDNRVNSVNELRDNAQAAVHADSLTAKTNAEAALRDISHNQNMPSAVTAKPGDLAPGPQGNSVK
jgi:conjugal transfer mating pair stabilization protein TraG